MPRCATRIAGLSLVLVLPLAGCAGKSVMDAPVVASDGSGCGSFAGHRALFRPVVAGRIDPVLMDRAIRIAANQRRCAAGVAPLAHDPRLTEAARIHASDMAEAGFVAPARPADPTKTLKVRFDLAGVGPYRRRGENMMRIALVPAPLDDGGRRCSPADGAAVVPTYRSIATRLVEAWSKSRAFSANLLSDDWTHTGAAVALRPVSGTCGELYAAQSFKAL